MRPWIGPRLQTALAKACMASCTSRTPALDRVSSVLGYLSRRARGKGARDGTRYGTSRLAPRTFFRHHVLHISMAAAIGDVQGLHKAVLNHKTRLCNGKDAPARADESEA